MKKVVCVIGAGGSGLVAAKELLDEGHTVVCFERNPGPGGVFCPTSDPKKPGVYDSAKLTISNYMMAFSSFPPRENDERRFWTAREYARYLSDFAENFNLSPVIQYDTDVMSISQNDDGKYDVEVSSVKNPEERTLHRFDAVAVCTGTNRVPNHIELEGQHEFTGKIIHSAYYKNSLPFRGKRVLCVGIGETSSDVTNEISMVAESCTLSVRRYQPLVQRYPRGRTHTSDTYTSRFLHALPIRTHNALMRFQWKMEIKQSKSSTDIGVAEWNAKNPDYHNYFVTKNEAFVDRITDGTLEVNSSGIERLTKDCAVFKDGTILPIDTIVLNTGYTNEFDIIKDIEIGDVRKMYKHMIHPELGAGIVFIGWARPAFGGVPGCSEMQSRYFALLCSGKKDLPKPQTLNSLIRAQAFYEDEIYFGNSEIRTLVQYTEYMGDFAKLIGCSPWRPSIFLRPTLAYRLWFGSQVSYCYRLFGPHSNFDYARETIMKLPAGLNIADVAFISTLIVGSRILRMLGVMKPDPAYS